jgi:hypothetical protein
LFSQIYCPQMNSEIVKSEMMILIEREKTDVTDADMTVNWIIYDGDREGERKLI